MTPRQRWTLICTVIGSGAVFLDGTIVNAALKHIGQELPGSIVGILEGQAYIVGGYLAVLAALLILSGALSDHYGRRRVYAIGLVGFAATSALVGLAPTLEWLIVFRLAQGAAGALLIPGSLALITHAFDGLQRARAFGIWAAATAALVVLGPIVGGLMVDTVGWRFAFLINVPLLGFALWATLTHVQESRDTETTGRFDWLGALVAALAVGGLAFGLIRGQANAWADPASFVVASASGVACLVLFPILMARRPHPLVPARPVPLAGVRLGQPRDLLHLRRAVRHLLLPGGHPAGRPRLHGAGGRGSSASRSGSCWRCCRRGSGRSPAASARAGSSSPDRC